MSLPWRGHVGAVVLTLFVGDSFPSGHDVRLTLASNDDTSARIPLGSYMPCCKLARAVRACERP